MKRQFSACQTPRSMYPSIFNTFPVIRTASAKNRRFHVPQPTFLFPLETPLWQSCNMLHGLKDKSMLAKPLAACNVPICLQLFPSYSNHKCKKSLFSRTAAHIFVSPEDAPAIITQYVAWVERQFNASQTPRSTYPSIFNSFPVIRTASAKNCRFHVLQPTFLFPLETPL